MVPTLSTHMQFVEIPLKDAFLFELEPKADSRGTFCRLFCAQLIKEHGIVDCNFVQANLSDNAHKGTLRGLHFQAEPYLEAKIVYCLRGSLYDVIVDLRKDSPTYLQHFGLKLAADDPSALYIPKGFAHGFLTLEDDCRLLYLMSDFYKEGYGRGYRYDDPAFGIQWPCKPKILSERDQNYPLFEMSIDTACHEHSCVQKQTPNI
jgi:dTDP-4-dehydrorhamnose 3,5-epimerase